MVPTNANMRARLAAAVRGDLDTPVILGLDIDTGVAPAKFLTMLELLVRRHPLLRAEFIDIERMRVQSPAPPPVRMMAVQGPHDESAMTAAIADLSRPLQPWSAPHLKAVGLVRNGRVHTIYMAIDHLVIDGSSLDVLMSEIDLMLLGRDVEYSAWSEHELSTFRHLVEAENLAIRRMEIGIPRHYRSIIEEHGLYPRVGVPPDGSGPPIVKDHVRLVRQLHHGTRASTLVALTFAVRECLFQERWSQETTGMLMQVSRRITRERLGCVGPMNNRVVVGLEKASRPEESAARAVAHVLRSQEIPFPPLRRVVDSWGSHLGDPARYLQVNLLPSGETADDGLRTWRWFDPPRNAGHLSRVKGIDIALRKLDGQWELVVTQSTDLYQHATIADFTDDLESSLYRSFARFGGGPKVDSC